MPNRLVTCGDCIHADVCEQLNDGWFNRKNIAYCKEFKDRRQYVEVVRGQWIDCSNGWMCSVCERDNTHDKPYCPNCGARMEQKERFYREFD